MVKKKVKKKSVKKKKAVKRSKKRDHEDRILKRFFLVLGSIIVLIFLIMTVAHLATNFKYEEVKFSIVKEDSLVFYQTSLPVIYEGEQREYNFYLRNDPRKLKQEVPFEGEIHLAETMVLNSESDFACDGDGIIAIANVVQLYNIVGVEVIKDENATCDPYGRYLHVDLLESNETKVVETSPGCYEIHIADCEILKGTERYMIDTFVEVHNQLN